MDETWRWIITGLLAFIACLVGIVYKALRDEARSIRQQLKYLAGALFTMELKLHPEQAMMIAKIMADLLAQGGLVGRGGIGDGDSTNG